MLRHYFRQLFSYVAVHIEILRILLLSGINVKVSALSKTPHILDTLNTCVPRRCIRKNTSDLMFLGMRPEMTFNWEVIHIIRETSKHIKDRVRISSLLFDRFIWQKYVESHFWIVNFAPMLHSFETTSKVFLALGYSYSVTVLNRGFWNFNNSSQTISRVQCIDWFVNFF